MTRARREHVPYQLEHVKNEVRTHLHSNAGGEAPQLERVRCKAATQVARDGWYPGEIVRFRWLVPTLLARARAYSMKLDAWPTRLLALVAMLFALGCNTIPEGRSSINEVQVRGADKVDEGDVAAKVATTESPKFLMLFRGVVYDYNLFDRNVLQRDLARIEAFYREKGYYDAHARAGRVHQIDKDHVRVEFVVEEGQPVLVKSVKILGLENVDPRIQRLAQRAAEENLKLDRPFDQEEFDKSVASVRRTLSDRGFAYAKVENDAAVDVYNHKVDVVLTTTVGPECTFGPVTIEGLGPLPDLQVRRALDIPVGKKYSEQLLDEAEQTLLDLGVVASMEMKPQLSDPPSAVVPIHVKVEPARLRSWKVGGGFEFDVLKTDVHGTVGWQHKNFFGGLRSFSVTFRPGLVLYPLRIGNIVAPNKPLPEEKLTLEFRQPGVIEARTNFFVRPELNTQALLINPNPPKDAPVLGYATARLGFGLDRTYKKFSAILSYNIEADYPFAYVGGREDTLSTIFFTYPQLVTTLDFRDNRQHPRKGVYLMNTLESAFLGDAKDFKVQPEARFYVPVLKKLTMALRGTVGLDFPRSYGNVVKDPALGTQTSVENTKDYQLTYFRGFFSGGPTSNRGYPLRGVGPYANVPFLSPEFAAQQVNSGCRTEVNQGVEQPDDGKQDCRSPTGGFTLWELSLEGRINISGPLSAVLFCDASDVAPQTAKIRLNRPHLSCGAGGRYDTPVGPVRLDIGYRIPGAQIIGEERTSQDRDPGNLFGVSGLPIAVSFGIGEAF